MRLKLLHLHLVVDHQIRETATQLRGFIGKQFEDHIEFHHHISSNKEKRKLLYEYPTIQYKIHDSKAIILAIGDRAISVLRKVVLNLEELKLGGNTYILREINARYADADFGLLSNEKTHRYRFISPWLALNEKNYQKFKGASLTERRTLLTSILIGNLLSISKNLGYEVPDTIQVEIELYPLKVLYKDVPLLGFKGLFESNFLIPDYLGVGKAVSHGFGTVKIFDDPK